MLFNLKKAFIEMNEQMRLACEQPSIEMWIKENQFCMKTTANQQSVEDFINSITDQTKKDDALLLIEMCKDITGVEPVMWGVTKLVSPVSI